MKKENLIMLLMVAAFVAVWISCMVTFNTTTEYCNDKVEETVELMEETNEEIVEWYNETAQNSNRPRSRVRNYDENGTGVQIREVVVSE